MRIYLLIFLFLISSTQCYNQKIEVEGRCNNPKFEKTVIQYLDFSVPYLTVKEVKKSELEFAILDAREKDEFNVSHLPGAFHAGYDNFDINSFTHLDKEKPLLVYCTIGYRSEKIGQKLQEAGFKKVYNLFGSITEWANQGHELEDNNGNKTFEVHTYNKSWGRWMDNPKYEKVY